jgi:hypothetical protein
MDTGAVVLKSMRAGGQPLLQSMYVTIIVILLFGFITYLVFEEDVENCDSVFRCVFTHLFVGFSRDLGDVFNENAFAIPHNVKKTDAGRVIGRTVFVWVYFVLWVVLLQGVIQGQIVDAFASIRDEEDADKEDLLQKCFVCSKERHEFASLSGGFNNHVEDNHNPWSYLGFLLALQEKDSIDYTGLESYVQRCFTYNDARFLPIGRSLCLDLHQASSGSADDIEARIQNPAAASALGQHEMQQAIAARLNALEKLADTTDVQQRLDRLEKGVVSISSKLDLLLAKQ